MAYMLAIGGLEYKAYEIECAVLRLKRKTELIQAKKNRQEDVLLPEIEELLDAEFAAYQAKLNEQIEKMNAALERNRSKRLSEEETRELKKLYRATVRLLHPDINPDLSEEKINLFHNAVMAHKNGDIDGLRIISMMVTGSTLPVVKADPAFLLVKERERLSKLLQSVREGIKKIKSEYPYNMKNFCRALKRLKNAKLNLSQGLNSSMKGLPATKRK